MTSRARRSAGPLLSVALAALVAGCADFGRGAPSAASAAPEASRTDGGGSSNWLTDVHPLLMGACASCHQSGAAAASTVFVMNGDSANDFDVVAALVDASSPSASRLLRKASGQSHGGGTVFADGSPELQTVLDWISTGALP